MENNRDNLAQPMFFAPGLPVGNASFDNVFLHWLASSVSSLLAR